MLYLLVHWLGDWIETVPLLGGLGALRWVEFRAVLAIVLAFSFVTLLGRRTIHWLLTKKIGDRPEFGRADLNELMKAKANTPTMGGVLICGGIFFVTLLLADLRPVQGFYVYMALVCLVWLFLLGLSDDWLKLTAAQRKPGSRQGLVSWEKMLLQLGLALVLGLFIHHYGGGKVSMDIDQWRDMSHSLTLPFFKTWEYDPLTRDYHLASLIVLPAFIFVPLAVLVIVGMSNAVNITDGMDGLASGTMVIVAFAFMLLALIAGWSRVFDDGTQVVLAKYLLSPHIPYADELAVVAGAMVGACLGFLWFNCQPARVFMGDSGSLPLGGLIGFIAVVIRQEFLLLLIGGVFVMEIASSMIQIAYFKMTGGKRVFRCAPIHHHFHLLGWTEGQIVVRFWLLSALFTALALATVKVR